MAEAVLGGEVLDYGDLKAWLRVDARTIQRWVRLGRFPRPLAIVGRYGKARWRRADVLTWLAQVPSRVA